MSYLTTHRHGLTKVEPTDSERQGGWKQVWEHPSGLRAGRHPVTGRWHVIDSDAIKGEGWSSSLRGVAAKIERLASESRV